MKSRTSLKDAERRAFASRFEDGLVDVTIGSLLMNFALSPLLNEVLGRTWGRSLFLAGYAVVGGIALFLWQHFVQPRKGVVVFRAERRAKVRKSLVLIFLLGLVALALILLSLSGGSAAKWTGLARFGLMQFLAFCAAAYFFSVERFYYYGLMVGTAPVIGKALHDWLAVPYHGIPVAFGAASAIIVVTGVRRLARFVMDYDVPTEETSDD